jgi:hypothetical protein
MIEPKLPVAALGTLEILVIKKRSQICGSQSDDNACFNLNFLFSIPVWFDRTRSMAKTFSSWVKNFACIGLSGRKKKISIPTMTVITPKIKNRIYECEHTLEASMYVIWAHAHLPRIECCASVE